MPSYKTGLSGQLMVAAETTVGTPVTVTTGLEFLPPENVSWTPTWLDGAGLRVNQPFKRASRTAVSRFTVGGDVSFEFADKGHMGLLVRHMLGSPLSAPVVIGASTAYDQYHVPGTKAGMGLTVQFGRPSTSLSTVDPYTYAGMKVTEWEFSVSDGEVATLKLTFDGWQESTATALVAASYTAAAGNFTFKDASLFKAGGTASTTAGKTTIAGGVTLATLAKGITITGTTPLATARYGLGNAGQKGEQFENDIQTITVSLDAEYTSRAELYDLFKANTTTALQLDLSHMDSAGKDAGGVAAGPNPYLLSWIFPALKIKDANVNVKDFDVLPQKIDLEAYDDGSGTNPVVQCHLVSSDVAL